MRIGNKEWPKKRQTLASAQFWDEEVQIGWLRTNLRELKFQTQDMHARESASQAEKGMATTILYLLNRLEEAERKEEPDV